MPKDCHGRLGMAVTVFLALGYPAASHAQSVLAVPSHTEPATVVAEAVQAEPVENRCVTALEAVPATALEEGSAQPEEKAGDAVSSPCSSLVPPPLVRPDAPDIFGSVAIALGSTVLDAHWNNVRKTSLEGVDGPWTELFAQAGQGQGIDPLILVNRWVNEHVRFVDDDGNDIWSDAADTIIRGTGDCEDYAIAKMALLRSLGVPPDDMYLVIVRDSFRKADHAVLAVRRDGNMQVLDNRTDMILSARQITDYRPLLSYSGPFVWGYGYPIGGQAVAAGHALLPSPQ